MTDRYLYPGSVTHREPFHPDIAVLHRDRLPAYSSDTYQKLLVTLALKADLGDVFLGCRELWEHYGWRAVTDFNVKCTRLTSLYASRRPIATTRTGAFDIAALFRDGNPLKPHDLEEAAAVAAADSWDPADPLSSARAFRGFYDVDRDVQYAMTTWKDTLVDAFETAHTDTVGYQLRAVYATGPGARTDRDITCYLAWFLTHVTRLVHNPQYIDEPDGATPANKTTILFVNPD